jgi:predicted lipoprotein with Yx(FWY)xxD motif
MRIMTRALGSSWLRRTVVPAAAIGMLTLAGCSSAGGSSGGSGGSSPSAGNGAARSAATTVMIGKASGKSVLVNAAGHTLYDNDQENGKVLCQSSACHAIWTPLTVTAGQTPTGPSALTGKLSTLTGAGGTTQVALEGKPLYTFSFDHSAGEDNGEVQDSFSDGNFTWHAATAAGAGSAPAASAPSNSSASPSSGGGFSYNP